MWIADFILCVHVLVVIFNVGGLMVILFGGPLGWTWVRHRGFRLAHVLLMGFVTIEAIFGMTCPLTVLEDWLRGVATEQSFIQRWASALIYWNAPPWVFAALYLTVLSAATAAWFIWPPTAAKYKGPRG